MKTTVLLVDETKGLWWYVGLHFITSNGKMDKDIKIHT